jgi:predicted transcriptional regulator
MPKAPTAAEARDEEIRTDIKLLRAMRSEPGGTQLDWADAIGRSKALVNKWLKKLADDGLVEGTLGKWSITRKGYNALEKLP